MTSWTHGNLMLLWISTNKASEYGSIASTRIQLLGLVQECEFLRGDAQYAAIHGAENSVTPFNFTLLQSTISPNSNESATWANGELQLTTICTDSSLHNPYSCLSFNRCFAMIIRTSGGRPWKKTLTILRAVLLSRSQRRNASTLKISDGKRSDGQKSELLKVPALHQKLVISR